MDKEEVKSVWSECVANVTKNDIAEVRVYAKPHELSRIVSKGLLIILDHKVSADSWHQFTKAVASPSAFLKRLLRYNIKEVQAKDLTALKALLKESGLDRQADNEKLKKVSKAMKQLHQWLLNLIEEAEANAELDKAVTKKEEL